MRGSGFRHRVRTLRSVAAATVVLVALSGALIVLSGVLVSPSAAMAAGGAHPNPIPAPASGCYLGAYVASGAAGLASFNEQAGRQQAFFLKFIDANEDTDTDSISAVQQFCRACYAAGALPYLTVQPSHATSSSLLTTADAAWLEDFTKAIGGLRRPVFIRFGHEMNGDWYPWGWGHVTPGVYIAGFRQVVDAFRRNAPQAAMVWAPSQNWGGDTDLLYSDWYPGDDYVDWVGLTSYQWPTSGVGEHQFDFSISNGEGPEGDFYTTFAVGHDKPMMIAETACGDDNPGYYDNEWVGGSQDETGTYGTGVGQGAQRWWIHQVYDVGEEDCDINVRYPRIGAVCWFAEGDYDLGGTDLSAHSTGFSAYRQAISDPYWRSFSPSAPVLPAPTMYSTGVALKVAHSGRVRTALQMRGTLSPSAAPGTVRITVARRVGRKWRAYTTVRVRVVRGAFAYAFAPRYTGSWRVVAEYTGGQLGAIVYQPSASRSCSVRVR